MADTHYSGLLGLLLVWSPQLSWVRAPSTFWAALVATLENSCWKSFEPRTIGWEARTPPLCHVDRLFLLLISKGRNDLTFHLKPHPSVCFRRKAELLICWQPCCLSSVFGFLFTNQDPAQPSFVKILLTVINQLFVVFTYFLTSRSSDTVELLLYLTDPLRK